MEVRHWFYLWSDPQWYESNQIDRYLGLRANKSGFLLLINNSVIQRIFKNAMISLYFTLGGMLKMNALKSLVILSVVLTVVSGLSKKEACWNIIYGKPCKVCVKID